METQSLARLRPWQPTHQRASRPGLGLPSSWCGPFKTWYHAYTVDPLANITAKEIPRVLGGEAAMWGELAGKGGRCSGQAHTRKTALRRPKVRCPHFPALQGPALSSRAHFLARRRTAAVSGITALC